MQAFFGNQPHQTFQQKMKGLFEMKDISEKTQMHLRNVYGNLAVCTSICALAMYMNAFTVLSGFLWQMVSMIGMGYMMYQISNHNNDEKTRIGYLWALSFFMGYLVGPAINQIGKFAPEILIQASVCTVAVFGSFSAVALFSKKRSYLFLGGIIASLSSAMFWYSTTCWLLGYSYYGGMVYMMTGLFVACLYIVYDTQLIIMQAESGNKDVPLHTMTLFIDLFDLFVRIVQLLVELQDKKGKKKNED